ncbi:hypothetical protein [Cereibacter sphaeroides]
MPPVVACHGSQCRKRSGPSGPHHRSPRPASG